MNIKVEYIKMRKWGKYGCYLHTLRDRIATAMPIFKKTGLLYRYSGRSHRYNISLCPSWGIQKYIRYSPYFIGDDIYIDLLVRTKDKDHSEYDFLGLKCDWKLLHYPSGRRGITIDNGKNMPLGLYPFRNLIKLKTIEASGKYKIKIRFYERDFVIQDWETRVLFTVLDKDIVAWNIYQWIIAAIIGAVVGAIVSLIFS